MGRWGSGQPCIRLWPDPRSTLLGSQDRQRFQRHAQISAAQGQGAPEGHLDGRNQDCCRHRIRLLRRSLRREIWPGGEMPDQGPRRPVRPSHDFPAEHWKHIRTSNPIKSTFATVRHRTTKTKGCHSRQTARAMTHQLMLSAKKKSRRLDEQNRLPEIIHWVELRDGIKHEIKCA